MGEKKIGGAGLRGQIAGETSICTVGVSGSRGEVPACVFQDGCHSKGRC